MNYSSRFWLYAPTGAFLLLAAAAMIHWWFLAGALEKKLAALKGQQAVPGIMLDWDSVTVGGFPFRLDASFVNFHAMGAGAHGPFSWKTEKFAAHALTYGRRQTVYEAAGRQNLLWTDAAGAPHTANVLPGSVHASSVEGEDGLRRFDLDVVDAGARDFTIRRFQFHMRRDPDGKSLDLMLKLDGWDRRKEVQVYATLPDAGAFMPLLKGEKPWPEAAAAWRAQGGKAKFSQVIAPGLDPETLLSPLY